MRAKERKDEREQKRKEGQKKDNADFRTETRGREKGLVRVVTWSRMRFAASGWLGGRSSAYLYAHCPMGCACPQQKATSDAMMQFNRVTGYDVLESRQLEPQDEVVEEVQKVGEGKSDGVVVVVVDGRDRRSSSSTSSSNRCRGSGSWVPRDAEDHRSRDCKASNPSREYRQ